MLKEDEIFKQMRSKDESIKTAEERKTCKDIADKNKS